MTVNTGQDNDIASIYLEQEEHKGSLFVANVQAGDDFLDASNSILEMVLFEDGISIHFCINHCTHDQIYEARIYLT